MSTWGGSGTGKAETAITSRAEKRITVFLKISLKHCQELWGPVTERLIQQFISPIDIITKLDSVILINPGCPVKNVDRNRLPHQYDLRLVAIDCSKYFFASPEFA